MSGDSAVKHVAIVGGGLVGALNACFLAKRKYKVDLYEMRDDIRTMEIVKGRSINLALSCRGIEALKHVGMEDEVLQNAIPMRARMIHDLDGECHPIPYGTSDQCINSVDRRRLNEVLLTAAEKNPNVTCHFNHKLLKCDFNTGDILFLTKEGKEVKNKVDLIIGNDGAFSAVRRQMMKDTLLDYNQEYIPHGYLELTIPPSSSDQFAMGVNYLHIWPRNEYMMIAIPNLDKSYTCTLILPFELYEKQKTGEDISQFFKTVFPDSVTLIGELVVLKMKFELSLVFDGSKFEQPIDIIQGDHVSATSPTYLLDFNETFAKFAMGVNYLHIWPRNEFMMIALPNLDKSFTCTLFMPFPMFDTLKTEEQIMQFFRQTFPDSIPLIGEELLKKLYLSSKPLPMVSIKCSPYHVKDKVVIMGDAAHAMVPFYGQGMNAGFEDCIVLNKMLDKYNDNLELALKAYTEHRNPDAKAICELAMYNYIEMRKSVNSKMFLLRKKVDNLLHIIFPNNWVPLYTMVSFSRERYHLCIEKRKWQDKVISRTLQVGGVSLLIGGILLARHFNKTTDIVSSIQNRLTTLVENFGN